MLNLVVVATKNVDNFFGDGHIVKNVQDFVCKSPTENKANEVEKEVYA